MLVHIDYTFKNLELKQIHEEKKTLFLFIIIILINSYLNMFISCRILGQCIANIQTHQQLRFREGLPQ